MLMGTVTPIIAGLLNLGQDAMSRELKLVVLPFVSMPGSYWKNMTGVEPVTSMEEPIFSLDSKAEVGRHEFVRLDYEFSPD
jgi:hypothetical protein